jgi:hypothetical protein
MSDFTARITEILRQAVPGGVWPFAIRTLAGLIAKAAEEHYRPRIETYEQLDALDVRTLAVDPNGEVWEKRTYLSGLWDCLSEDGNGGLRTPPLPIVVWSSGAGE